MKNRDERMFSQFGDLRTAFKLDKWEIPIIQKQSFKVEELIAFNYVMNRPEYDKAVHFFLSDDQFLRLWNKPWKYLDLLRKFAGCLSPDFSLFRMYPLSFQLYNIYRNRMLGAFWQANGINVIPSISWSNEESYDFCFLGVEKGSTVAISNMGIHSNKEAIKYFKKGYDAMMKCIQPKKVILYGGQNFDFLEGNIKYIKSETRWKDSKEK